MNVKLAATELSSTVIKDLCHYGPYEDTGASQFCSLMYSVLASCTLETVNIRIMNIRHRKPFCAPISPVYGQRFSWLQNVFLEYFKEWLASLEQYPGNFSRIGHSNMFVSKKIYKGLNINCMPS